MHFLRPLPHRLRRQSGASLLRATTWAAKTTSADSISGASARSRSCRATRTVNVFNNDGTQRVQKQIINGGQVSYQPVTMTIPTYQFAYPGGDTSVVTNFEYRIPIFGPVMLALFADAGIDKLIAAQPAEAESGPRRSVERRIPAGGLQRARLHRAGHSENARVHRTRTAGPDAGGQRALPALLGLQSERVPGLPAAAHRGRSLVFPERRHLS